MQVSIIPSSASTESVVSGFPGLGPVLIEGICRIVNITTMQAAARRAGISYVSVDLTGNTWGNGGRFTSDLSLIHGKRILYESSIPTVDLYLEPNSHLDLPFKFELQQDYASVLPPSFDTTSLLSIESRTEYSLQAVIRCDLPDLPSISASKSFLLPRFDPVELKQVLLNQRNTTTHRFSNQGAAGFVTMFSPKAIVPGDKFSVAVSAQSLQAAQRVIGVRVEIVEYVRVTEELGGGHADADRVVFSWQSTPQEVMPSQAIDNTELELEAPMWQLGGSKPTTPAATTTSITTTINPTSVSGGVEVSHRISCTLLLENHPGGPPISVSSPVSVVPVTRPMLDNLLTQTGALVASPDVSVSSFGRFLNNLRAGTLPRGGGAGGDGMLSEEDAIQQAIALSMQEMDEVTRVLRESEEQVNQPAGMSEEEALRIAIAESMGVPVESLAGGAGGASGDMYGSGSSAFEAETVPALAAGSASVAVEPEVSPAARSVSRRTPRRGTMADRKAFLMSGSVVESAASYVSASTRRADRAHLKMSADEMDVAVGDVIVVVETFEDDWAEGYNVTSKASGRFPCVVLGEGEALSGMLATDAGPPSNWISLASIEVKEYELDGKLQANLISTKSYLLERQRVIRGIV